MSYFKVLLLHKGKTFSFTLEASSKKEAIKKLPLKGNILAIQLVKKPIILSLQEQLNLLKQPLALPQLIFLFTNLSMLLSIDINFEDALKESISQCKNKSLQKLLEQILQNIQAGKGISESFASFKTQFGTLSLSFISLGEYTGKMHEALKVLCTLLESIHIQKKRMQKATRYPKQVFFIMLLAFSFLVSYIVPIFKHLFAKNAEALPLPTKILIFLESLLKEHAISFVLFFLSLWLLTKLLFLKKPQIRFFYHRFLCTLPFFKELFFYYAMQHFFIVLHTLHSSGISFIKAMELANKTLHNSYLQQHFLQVHAHIRAGKNISYAFESTDLFEELVLQMFQTAEKTGQIEQVLLRTQHLYKERFEQRLASVNALIEPALLLVIALCITTLGLGIFMPLWQMQEGLGL